MCPGGTVVAATSEPGRVVTNGMSQYSRNERNANAAIVVGIEPGDFAPFDASGSPLAGIALQRALESHAYTPRRRELQRARRNWSATSSPARRRRELGQVQPSYKPGVTSGQTCDSALPDYAIEAIREALPAFDRQIARASPCTTRC